MGSFSGDNPIWPHGPRVDDDERMKESASNFIFWRMKSQSKDCGKRELKQKTSGRVYCSVAF